MEIVKRDDYLNRLVALKDKHIIKIITGIRRCGKSTLLELFKVYLSKHGVERKQMISINFEDLRYADLRSPKNLNEYILSKATNKGKYYIFLDEIQQVENFPEVIDSLFLHKNLDLYVTGSNAKMLSSEIATMISGRYIEIAMMPFSFKEYVEATNGTKDLHKAYNEYITFGSFPMIREFGGDERIIGDYLVGIFNTIVVKDVMARNEIRDTMMLESIVRFMFDNIGNTLSTKRISDIMTSGGRKIDVKTVERYINALMESFVLYRARRYNIKGGQLLKTMEKYYVVDTGLRNMLLSAKGFDAGRILENVVYLELLRRYDNVFIGKIGNMEVDFVCSGRDGVRYYQVAATTREKSTLDRELASLRSINDSYPKFLITLDDDPTADYDGIKRINAIDWLME